MTGFKVVAIDVSPQVVAGTTRSAGVAGHANVERAFVVFQRPGPGLARHAARIRQREGLNIRRHQLSGRLGERDANQRFLE